ncbi:hypothetical protein H3Z83_12345 [Tenacibaculum sp. S7007]|uniref:Uncharacterized protein n=1 Tax=Tenacibaculum pelagium TaxID=2759527 RepID=A0A839ASN6_9FLAO|nr:hypothetical protein [Tenacibaculum pelagium]MBA6157299.1 hypothetical protein [Tenacibaculum pelagium]
MDNSNNANGCTPNQESKNNTDCCTSNTNSKNKNGRMKKKIGLGILGLALIFAFMTAFKGSSKAEISCITAANTPTLSIADFEWIKTDKKVAYVVLKGNNTNQNQEITLKVESIINELNETDGSAHFLALEANNPNYQDVVSKLKIEETPSIVVLGKSALIINGSEVNSAKLIRAYDVVLTPKASCSPAEKAACAEKNNTSYDLKAKVSCTPQQKAACSGSKKTN